MSSSPDSIMYTLNSTDGYSLSVPSNLALKSGLISDIKNLNDECTEFPEIEVENEILKIIFEYLDEDTDKKVDFITRYHNIKTKNRYIPRILSGLYYLKIQESLEEWCDYVSSYINKFGDVEKSSKSSKNELNVSDYEKYLEELFM